MLGQSLVQSNIEQLVRGTSKYPMAYITVENKKVNDRLTAVCDEMYSLNNTMLGEMRESWRELVVMYQFAKNIKHPVVGKQVGKFQAYFALCSQKLAAMYKKESLLQEYWLGVYFSKNEINKVFELFRDDVQGDEASIEAYKASKAETQDMLKKRFK